VGSLVSLNVIVPPYFGVSGLAVVVVGAVDVGAVVVAVVTEVVSSVVPQEVNKIPKVRIKAANKYLFFKSPPYSKKLS